MRLPQLSFGKILAGTAVVLVATTGTAYAHGMINSADIVNGSIRSVDIGSGEVKSVDIGNSTIRSADIFNGGVKSDDVLDNSLTADDLASGSVGQLEIQTDGVAATEIADDSIDSGEIQNGTLARADLNFDVPVVLAALVQSNGTLSRGIGATASSRTDTGIYTVTFNQSIGNCFANVTGTGDQHDEMASTLSGSVVTVDIEDPDQEDVQNDASFFLTVVCPA
ncbi:hypothetical protein [Nocardioides bizhenqiangii]|uniref:Uncharacterized protein n=1 Tax=Nocardioides bizhenqiangii TaxID=3095076 RepID=A0ABZ0ZRU8_9ACTN|nr:MULTISPECIES: hypothetical protein [unclassified Nocardioides]MDZ5622760.1 hypothetical protein [Nocardioides sp. HM23]WQQ27022.1 hypothetical protein SHK19_02045 [Nocardioides sp. HM61]